MPKRFQKVERLEQSLKSSLAERDELRDVFWKQMQEDEPNYELILFRMVFGFGKLRNNSDLPPALQERAVAREFLLRVLERRYEFERRKSWQRFAVAMGRRAAD